MLAYVFWHRPRDEDGVEVYEQALLAFHRSLARSRPVGLRSSAAFRVEDFPWPQVAPIADGPPSGGYEDWYLLDDYAALGVLNEAAVGLGHSSAHDEVARRFGSGAGGLYGLLEGNRDSVVIGGSSLAVWVSRPAGSERRALGELLGDGMDPTRSSLWRRQLVLGPAPEFCLLACEASQGVAPERLPVGWAASQSAREALWDG